MKSKKEQILLQLKKKCDKWNLKLTLLAPPLVGVRPTLTPKGGCSKLFAACSKPPHLGTIPLVQQTHRFVPIDTWLSPLAETTPRPDKVRLRRKKGKGSTGRVNPLGVYHRYAPPQNRRPAILVMLRMHLKQLKTFMRSVKNLLPSVVLPCVLPTYFLSLSLGTPLLPPDRTGTPALGPVVTKPLWDKRSKCASNPGSRVNKVIPPRVINNKKNSPTSKKVVSIQEDLVKKVSRFINIWCYLQSLFFFFCTLRQPMVVLGYPTLGCRPVNYLTFAIYFLSPNPFGELAFLTLAKLGSGSKQTEGCFLIWVRKFGCYPCCSFAKQTHKIFVTTGLSPATVSVPGPLPTVEERCRMHATTGSTGTTGSHLARSAGEGIKVGVLALHFLPQLTQGNLKINLEERVSKASLPRVKKARLPNSIRKRKSSGGLFCKQEMQRLQINNFYKYLGFCDYIMFKIVWKWCSRKHSNQSAQWIRRHYFYKLNGQSWVFALKKILFTPW